ncbi:hypothetical protein HUT16_11455 [Kitasatospora sp. NA04385]|uniref:hypothetical protein n=1 Tax=Kitasatospora sp. NA04385 TaxID=2742135 RepID=UPI001591C6A3|nr:hypothetical protein [Kitasatospora sp. NA04385]QKW19601.1 hypothetical protein HUT16_11455 [Kitasatospora sp. NA04385]
MPSGPGTENAMTDAAGFAAFVLLHRSPYERYAEARLGDRALGHRAVAEALRRTALDWTSLLSDQRAMACAWRILRETVTSARAEAAGPGADSLHLALPGPAADAVLLHHGLGYHPKVAAELMGLAEPELQVDLMAARRILGSAGRGGEVGGQNH